MNGPEIYNFTLQAVPRLIAMFIPGALGYWAHRFVELGVKHEAIAKRFGDSVLTFTDPDGLTTQVAPHLWKTLSDAEKAMFTEVALEAAARATAQIKKRESELVDEFKKKGLGINAVNRQSFVDAVLKNKSVESMGFDKKDYDRIVAVK